jgi:hypothetical protein
MKIVECQFQAINFSTHNNEFGMGIDFMCKMAETLLEVQFPAPDERIQFELSNRILYNCHRTYENFSTALEHIKCDPRFNYRYDGAFINDECNIGIEIQFRPDFLKDITRFQLGFHSGRFQAIVYIVASKKNTINPRYISMPQFDNMGGVLAQLKWFKFPILLVGINCEH